jgi:hypothetical protein
VTDWEGANELEWSRFQGSVAQFIGQPLSFDLADTRTFELSFDGSLLGRLTRPSEDYLAETEDGSWTIRHAAASAAHIEALEPSSGALAAEYRRRALGSGGTITTALGVSYRLRPLGGPLRGLRGQQRWQLAGPDGGVVLFKSRAQFVQCEITPLSETAPSGDLALLMLLSAYVLLVSVVSVPGVSGDAAPGM